MKVDAHVGCWMGLAAEMQLNICIILKEDDDWALLQPPTVRHIPLVGPCSELNLNSYINITIIIHCLRN